MTSLYRAVPPSPPLAATISDSGSAMPTNIINIPQQPPYMDTLSSSSPSPSSSSVTIVIVVIAAAIIISAVIYLLLRSLSSRFRPTNPAPVADGPYILRRSASTASNKTNSNQNNLIDPLPLFTFRSVTGHLAGGGCAVCLSKFEQQDQLRLLPLCCHAFHAGCIDTWLVTNQTCPLCRSTVKLSDSDVLDKIHSDKNRSINNDNYNNSLRNGNGNDNENGRIFRVEIGSISRHRDRTESGQHSYSIGSFEYVVEHDSEVSIESTTQGSVISDCDKESSVRVPIGEPPGDVLAREASVGRNWMMDCIDRLTLFSLSSRTMSYRNSGNFFSGSSRRSDSVFPVEDLEANRMGEEISEFFQWLSL